MTTIKISEGNDEFKESSKSNNKVQSPKHIFDPQLFTDININDVSESVDEIAMNIEPSLGKTIAIDHDQGIFSLRYSPDGSLLAVGCSDGGVRIINKQGRLQYRLKTSGNLPVTSMKWRPSLSGVGTPVLVTTSSSGTIDHWHVQSQKSIYSIVEQDNQIFCLDYTNDGLQFATAGKDKIIRIYDDQTKKEVSKLETGVLGKSHGHSNRVFALKYKPDDKNVIISGSWDNTVLLWDVRSKISFRSIYGPHIAGQAVDIQNDVIVTGSWRVKKSLQTWEFKTGKPMLTVNWLPSPMIYTCHYCPTMDGIVAAAGTGINELRLVNVQTGAKSKALKLKQGSGIYSLDWTPNGDTLVFGGDGHDLQFINVTQIKQSQKNQFINEILAENNTK